MLVVGLTGGVASGKTTVSQILREEGAYLINADEIARQLVEPHAPTWHELRKVFGNEFFDENGSIQRRKLASRVFSDPEQRSLLNNILHPQIKSELKRRIHEIAEKDPDAVIIIDAPLLVETGNHREMDKVIVIASNETQQIQRLVRRSGLSEEEARRIFASQMPFEEKMKVADFIIPNEGPLEETTKKAKEVFQELKKMAIEKREQEISS